MTHAPTAALAIALLFAGAPARALSGGGYDLSHNAIAGGGRTFSIGGGYQLGGTIGQAAAGTLAGGAFAVHGGFWVAPQPEATPTETATSTATATATRTAAPPTPTATASIAPSATTTRSATPTRTVSVPPATFSPTPASTVVGATSTPSHSPTPSPTPTPDSMTPSPAPCAGDCNENGAVTVDELIRGVNIALGLAAVDTCAAMDANADGTVAVNELIAAVNRALGGCPSAAEGEAAAGP